MTGNVCNGFAKSVRVKKNYNSLKSMTVAITGIPWRMLSISSHHLTWFSNFISLQKFLFQQCFPRARTHSTSAQISNQSPSTNHSLSTPNFSLWDLHLCLLFDYIFNSAPVLKRFADYQVILLCLLTVTTSRATAFSSRTLLKKGPAQHWNIGPSFFCNNP